jgi:hypothetical protein
MRRCLVVAHQTLDSPRLEEAMWEEVRREPCGFHLVVPMLPRSEGMTWTEAKVRATAQEHLNQALSGFRLAGFSIDGEVGGTSPVDAVGDVLLRDGDDAYALVMVSTLPHTVSRWLKVDVPARIARSTGLPVHHVEAPDRAVH